MYTAQLSESFLTKEEQEVFQPCLAANGLEDNIWDVFSAMFEAGTKHSRPLILRISDRAGLQGACIILRCNKYGRALFGNPALAGLINLSKIPCYLWIRFGCCMDMISNPGFVRDPGKTGEITREMVKYLEQNCIVSMVTDYTDNSAQYPAGTLLPALPHALIDMSGIDTLETYIQNYKNIRRKRKVFAKKGGYYQLIDKQLNREQINSLRECFIVTSEKSVFYLPYQDLYLNSALHTSKIPLRDVYYFVAFLEGEFLGYQAAIKSGKHLNALHGAFDRKRPSTYHAYDILFVKMTEFALEHGLELIDFGAVLNATKQRMVNKTIELSYYLMSRYGLIRRFFGWVLKSTRIQGREQLKFR
jgi:hypothetical protein